MLHHTQRFAGEAVDELVFHLGLQVEAELVDDIRRMGYVLWYGKLALGGLPEVLSCLLEQLGVVLPFLDHFGEDAERGDARRHIVLIAALGHQREESRHDGHRGLEGHYVAVIADAGTGVLVWVVAYIFAEFVTQYAQECRLRAGEEGLADAAALIEVMVVGYLFLVFVPKTFFHYGRLKGF